MQYLLMLYTDEKLLSAMSPEENQRFYAEFMKVTAEIKESKHYVGGNPLHTISTATTVRVRNGKAQRTDGPFAETREQLGGYYLIEANDLDEACALAARIPSARLGSIEVRPVRPMPKL